LNGLRYGAISGSGKKVAIVAERPKRKRHTLKLIHKFAETTPEKRPQDPSLDGIHQIPRSCAPVLASPFKSKSRFGPHHCLG
jgi:hypothetical protein